MSRTLKPDFIVMVGVAPLQAPLRVTVPCFVFPTDLSVGVPVLLFLPHLQVLIGNGRGPATDIALWVP